MAALIDGLSVHMVCGMSYEDVVISDTRDTIGIINTDVSSGGGKHWVSFIHLLGGPTIYYDSLGEPPTAEMAAKISDGQLIYWDGQQQPDSSDKCGFYALNFIKNLANHWDSRSNIFDFYDHGMNFTGTSGNEKKALSL